MLFVMLGGTNVQVPRGNPKCLTLKKRYWATVLFGTFHYALQAQSQLNWCVEEIIHSVCDQWWSDTVRKVWWIAISTNHEQSLNQDASTRLRRSFHFGVQLQMRLFRASGPWCLSERHQPPLVCDNTDESQGGSKFWVCGWNIQVPPLKWNLTSKCFPLVLFAILYKLFLSFESGGEFPKSIHLISIVLCYTDR